MKKQWTNDIIEHLKPKILADRYKKVRIKTDILDKLMKERD